MNHIDFLNEVEGRFSKKKKKKKKGKKKKKEKKKKIKN